jgi:hypothetical protein
MSRAKTNTVRWVGPFRLRHLLEQCLEDNQAWPPEGNGVYVVSERSWRGIPKKQARVLYVGGNTSTSPLFLTRVGSLIADMLGFWWHHSGGQSLYTYCKENNVHPLNLHLGWAENISCCRCAEVEVYRALEPSLCKRVPASCKEYVPPLCGCL